MKSFTHAFLWLFASITFVSCGSSLQTPTTPAPLGQISESLYTVPKYQYSSSSIPVCFETNTLPSAADQTLIRNAITSAYEPQTSLHFIGWGTCSTNAGDKYTNAIRVAFKDSAPHTGPFVGTNNAGVPNNIILNNTFKSWSTDCSSSEAQREQCLAWTAVHEFGHAISALHEHTRPDTNPDCTAWLRAYYGDPNVDWQAQSGNGMTIAQGAPRWDLQSTMDYCNDPHFSWNGNTYDYTYNLQSENGGVLSAGDLTNWQTLYGSSKMIYGSSSAFGESTSGIEYGLVNTKRSSNKYYQPDLYMVQFSGQTNSGYVEIWAASSSSSYKTLTTHTVTPEPIINGPNNYFDYMFAQIDSDDSPEYLQFTRNYGSDTIQLIAFSGASNWQSELVNTSLPLNSNNNYGFAFADYDGDSSNDLFTMRMVDSARLEISVFKGPTFSTMLARSYVPYTVSQANNCRWVVGNFYNHTASSGGIDVVCLNMDVTSTSTPIYIVAWQATGTYSNPYAQNTAVATTQLLNEDGQYASFGFWQTGTSAPSGNAYPGVGTSIGYIKRQETAGTAEVYFFNDPLYF